MKKKQVKHHLLMYVVNSSPAIKKFTSMDKMEKFVKEFQKKYPDEDAINTGSWIDYVVTGVTGEIYFFVDGIEVN
jgi:hypothetical protein